MLFKRRHWPFIFPCQRPLSPSGLGVGKDTTSHTAQCTHNFTQHYFVHISTRSSESVIHSCRPCSIVVVAVVRFARARTDRVACCRVRAAGGGVPRGGVPRRRRRHVPPRRLPLLPHPRAAAARAAPALTSPPPSPCPAPLPSDPPARPHPPPRHARRGRFVRSTLAP